MAEYRTEPSDSPKLPTGIPHIVGNEAAERFSFYGMKAGLAIFLANYLGYLGGESMSETQATVYVAAFTAAVYFTPFFGALVSDWFWGKYRTIITLSVVYCVGHLCLALMGIGGIVQGWLLAGLGFIAIGAGGIKPCVSAHVGDQFGPNNQHLLTKVFNLFYLSINLGAAISNLLIPWLLEWYGPHWAFGLPGILMALATVVFWIGRHRFVHVPASGSDFVGQVFSKEGLGSLAWLIPLFLFVAVFWSLFDQTASTLVFQAVSMDRHLFGIELLPSQIQAANPILILLLIPVFAFGIYPAVGKVVRVTPLRKMATGMFLMTGAFALVAIAQEKIDAGQAPHVTWQLAAYVVLTSAEIMISIVGLEFAYTQAPKHMKSMMMSLFLFSVFVGNGITALVNIFIQIDEPAKTQLEAAIHRLPSDWQDSPQNVVLPGYDGTTGTDDDLIARVENGKLKSAEFPGREAMEELAKKIGRQAVELGRPPTPEEVGGLGEDPWGNAIRYDILNSLTMRLTSAGADGEMKTPWDLTTLVSLAEGAPGETKASWSDRFHPDEPWLIRHGGKLEAEVSSEPFTLTSRLGGGNKLEKAAYFWFFTALMAATAVLFVPFAVLYRPRTQEA
ncbi:MFS transporter [Haloferula sargassicola]|uniref:Dipeptide and tripeptide permease A n=1 Tax=Haloferula sargassicola TaxID=490096 RepID=A0ABP9ULL5_9BACT